MRSTGAAPDVELEQLDVSGRAERRGPFAIAAIGSRFAASTRSPRAAPHPARCGGTSGRDCPVPHPTAPPPARPGSSSVGRVLQMNLVDPTHQARARRGSSARAGSTVPSARPWQLARAADGWHREPAVNRRSRLLQRRCPSPLDDRSRSTVSSPTSAPPSSRSLRCRSRSLRLRHRRTRGRRSR